MIDKVQRHWVIVLFVAAVAISVYLSFDKAETAAHKVDTTRSALIKRCLKAAPRAAYNIAFQLQAAETRRATGSIVTADRYQALANAGSLTIAAPPGFEGSPQLVEITYTRQKDGSLKAVLTKRALTLQKAGCEAAFPAS